MDTKDMIKSLQSEWGITIKDLAKSIGWNEQKFYNKLNRKTLKLDDMLAMLDANDIGIKLVEVEGEQGQPMQRRGLRARAMVDGVVYDTGKAEFIAVTVLEDGSVVELFRDSAGRYFLVEQKSGGLSKIRCLPEVVARTFSEKYGAH